MKTYLILVSVLFAGMLHQVCAQSLDEIIVQKRGLTFAYYHNGRQLRNNELLYLLDDNPEAKKELKKAHRNMMPARVLSYTGGLILAYPISAHIAGGTPSWTMAGIGAGLLFLSLPFTGAVMKREHQAIYVYNGGLQYAAKPRVNMEFGYEQKGATLKISF